MELGVPNSYQLLERGTYRGRARILPSGLRGFCRGVPQGSPGWGKHSHMPKTRTFNTNVRADSAALTKETMPPRRSFSNLMHVRYRESFSETDPQAPSPRVVSQQVGVSRKQPGEGVPGNWEF